MDEIVGRGRDRLTEFDVDLLLNLRGARGRRALGDAVREAARAGRLRAGAAVPSSRALARELGLARNTVAAAYEQLVAEGWLESARGSGTRVADHPALGSGAPVRGSVAARPRFDLTPGTPDLSRFPREAWQRAARRALAAAPHEMLGYPDPRGLPGLRHVLVEYLARARGVRTTADHVVVCSGFSQALHLLASVSRRRGVRQVAFEDHGLRRHLDIVRAAGLDPSFLPIDPEGAQVDALADADVALLTPAHQFPTGITLSPARRQVALRWARRSGALLVEDDYDGEFRYDRKPVGALQGSAPDLVAYVGTASKSLAPGLSLAWLVCPPPLLADVVRAKRDTDGHTGVFEQLALEEFVRSGAYDNHIRRSRLIYRRRRHDLLASLADRGVQATPRGAAAGLHVVIDLPGHPTADEAHLQREAAHHDLAVGGLSEYRSVPDPDATAALVIGYSRPPGHAFTGSLRALGDLLTAIP